MGRVMPQVNAAELPHELIDIEVAPQMPKIDRALNQIGQQAAPLIVGVNDPAASADVMEQTWMVFFPEAEMTILPDAGHYPMFEAPVSLATSIEEFLGRE